MSSNSKPSIGIVGGTGDLGRGLALRLATAGHAVLVGSRKSEQAVEAAEALTAELTQRGVAHPPIEGLDNVSAAHRARSRLSRSPLEPIRRHSRVSKTPFRARYWWM